MKNKKRYAKVKQNGNDIVQHSKKLGSGANDSIKSFVESGQEALTASVNVSESYLLKPDSTCSLYAQTNAFWQK